MRVIHSFWSKPFLNDRWGVTDQYRKNIFTYSLSALYAKQLFGNITLVCDDAGATLLESIGYDHIDTSLNGIAHINPKYWTYGKVKALSLYDEPVLHIDGDVLLNNKALKKIFDSYWDVMVQMKEVGTHFTDTYSGMLAAVNKAVGFIDYALYNYVYNCGIIGFKNIGFKNKYCQTFFDTIEKCEENVDVLNKLDGKYELNCVLEQSLLTFLSQSHNVYVKELLPLHEMTESGLEGLANKMGYSHLWGKSKYEDYWVGRLKSRLLELDMGMYKKVMHQYESHEI
jgi:hypothetical protein